MLRPPSHRGPLIAAGATVLTVGVVLQQLRQDEPDTAVQLAVWGGLSALLLWLSVGSPLEGGRPPAYQSVLIVCGLGTLVPALLHLADLLGAELDGSVKAGTGTWVALVTCGAATLLSVRRNSGIAAFLAAISGAAFVVFAADWVADPSVGVLRVLALLIATTLVIVSLVLRGSRPRQSEQLVNAAGLTILAIPVAELFEALFAIFGGTGELLPGFWEAVVLAAGFGLIAYASADRAPGPAYLGVANLTAFVAVTTTGAQDTLEWWPFTLLAIGALMLVAGLRPARPLPPEPEGYRRDELPLSSRVDGGEQVFTVRD
jgi:hypothetical protein